MKRKKPPVSSLKYTKEDKAKIKRIIKELSGDWNVGERETSILFDYGEHVVYLETSYGPTARRWFENMWGDENIIWDTNADSLKITVPWEYCRQADLILKKKYREYNG